MDQQLREPDLPRYGNFIGGQEIAPSTGEYFPTENPYDGKVWAEIARGDARDVDAAVTAAHAALNGAAWASLTATQRGALLRRLADLIIENAPHLAAIEMRDNGKLAAEVTGQVRYLGDYYHYYAGLADKVQGAVIPTDKKGVFAYTKYEAKGVVGIITPWNSPLA
ncbi:MAG: aldehyde dehydrogenase family protein, partial [Pandoraea sp.]|nr:aldehyde dehydrogenase family protein [Pandoraea sp.]